jgi:hypothetical protein
LAHELDAVYLGCMAAEDVAGLGWGQGGRLALNNGHVELRLLYEASRDERVDASEAARLSNEISRGGALGNALTAAMIYSES